MSKKDDFDFPAVEPAQLRGFFSESTPAKAEAPKPEAAAQVEKVRPRPNPNRTRKPGSGKVSKALEEGRKAMEETHYTQEEALGILGLCYNTFKKYLDAGYLHRVRYGRPYWVPKEDIPAFIEGVKNGTITQLPNK